MSKELIRKTKKKKPVVNVKAGSNRARPQGPSVEAKKLAAVSDRLPARDRKVLLAMARILAGTL
jgi:hypothetical protein